MNISSDQPCVSVCCKHDSGYPDGARCYWNVSYPTEESIFPKIFDFWWKTHIGPKGLLPRDKIHCPGNTVCYSDCISAHNVSTYFLGNSTISMNDSLDGGLTCRVNAKDYCFKSQGIDGTKNAVSVCKTFFYALGNLKLSNAELSIKMQFLTYTMAISLPFLVATFLIYTMLPELKNLHGLLIRTYMACCFGLFVTAIILFTHVTMMCNAFLLILQHFTFLTTFTWLNVMSFDIWWTFRSLRECSRRTSQKKYIVYSIYAWGIPMLIIGVGLIIEVVPDVPKGIIRPGLRAGCWLGDSVPEAVYFEGPLTIMIVGNICFLMLAIINITRQKKATAECLEGSDSRRYSDEKNRFHLYLKLFIIMGMTWLSEVQGFIVKRLPYQPYLGLILECPNTMQGVIIFILFVWNDRTKRLLSKHLGSKDRGVIQRTEHAVARNRVLALRPQVS